MKILVTTVTHPGYTRNSPSCRPCGPGLCRFLGRISLFPITFTHGTGVVQHHQYRGGTTSATTTTTTYLPTDTPMQRVFVSTVFSDCFFTSFVLLLLLFTFLFFFIFFLFLSYKKKGGMKVNFFLMVVSPLFFY